MIPVIFVHLRELPNTKHTQIPFRTEPAYSRLVYIQNTPAAATAAAQQRRPRAEQPQKPLRSEFERLGERVVYLSRAAAATPAAAE